MELTEKIIYLCNLNRTLKLIEREIIDRAIVCLETGENKFWAGDPFTADYEVEAEVTYYLDTKGDDEDDDEVDEYAHRYWTVFSYQETVVNKDYGMLLDNGNGTDWHREGDMPLLDEPYCYLLHDLIDHSTIGDGIYDIERIWIDVIYTDQKAIKIKKDGSWRMLIETDGGFG